MFNIYINDPLVINAKKSLHLPPMDGLKFSVQGFKNQPHKLGTVENQENQVWILIANSISFANSYLPKPLEKWAATPVLQIVPRAGRQVNAFYDRSSLKFYYDTHPVSQKMIYLCESSDIVCHELGHAILDAMRPDFWNNPMLEVMAFHEAFADINAMLSTLSYQEMINHVLLETNGDLRKSNSVSRIAEQMGELLSILRPNSGRSKEYLRNLCNDYCYVDYITLENIVSDDSKLSKSPHSFSRIFSGTIYEIIVSMYEYYVSKSFVKADALLKAKDLVASALFKGTLVAGIKNKMFESIARNMVSYLDDDEKEIATKVFIKKGIFDNGVIPVALTEEIPMSKDNKLVKMQDYFQGDNPLYAVQVEIPSQEYKSINDEENELIHIKNSLDYLAQTDKVDYNGDQADNCSKEFRIEDGKLVRNCCMLM